MKFLRTSRRFSRKLEKKIPKSLSNLPSAITDHLPSQESPVLKTVGWISAGLGAVALGLFVGRELRQRYKFNRRTPYDLYAHSGDEQDVEVGLGI